MGLLAIFLICSSFWIIAMTQCPAFRVETRVRNPRCVKASVMSTSRSDMLLEALDKVDGMLGGLMLVGTVVDVDIMCGNLVKLNLRD